VKLQRPILVGGLGLSFALWMFDTWQEAFSQVGEVSLLGLLAVGGGLLLFKQRSPKVVELLELPCDHTTVENAILQAEVAVNQLANEVKALDVTSLTAQISQLQAQIDRKEINIAVTGGKSVGKTSLIQVLASNWQPSIPQTISFHDTAPLFVEAAENSDAVVLKNAIASDYVLFLTNGDLTDSEFKTLQQLKSANQRAMVVFNKQDQYTPAERTSILLSLQQLEQVNVATSSVPVAIKVRKHNDDGTVQEWMEQPAPDLQQLTSVLGEVLTNQGQQLIWATTVRKAQLLKADVKNQLNNVRKERATPVIEQYQWYCAAAAFANPVPALDILATAAINGQMVMDLGGIYQQKFSLEQAKTVAVEMGSLMLKLGLVELSTKAISTVLKSNAVTYAVGGVIQGVSAAYLTRVAGLALVEYFQAQEIAVNSGNGLNLDKLRQTLQNVFQQNQQVAFLQGFVSQGVKRLLPEVQQGEVVETMV
jgi:GTPase SAR1 family protein